MDYKFSNKLTDRDRKNINGYFDYIQRQREQQKPAAATVQPETPSERVDMRQYSLLTVKEVAEMLRISKATLKRMERRGEIRSVRINSRRDRRYLREEIINFIQGNNNEN